MGKKSHPLGLRVGYSMNWQSRWFDLKNYARYLWEDYQIREYLFKRLKRAALARVEIERFGSQAQITLATARPGLVIGRGGSELEELKRGLKKIVSGEAKLNVQEIKSPEAEAAVVAAIIVEQIERRIPFRRAIKAALEGAQRLKVKGMKVVIAGRLNGAEISRTELFHFGTVPLHTFRVPIDYAQRTAFTTYGTVGVKVWIYREEGQ